MVRIGPVRGVRGNQLPLMQHVTTVGLVPVVEVRTAEGAEAALGVVDQDREWEAGVAPQVPAVLIPHVAHDHLTRVELRHTMRVMRFAGGFIGMPIVDISRRYHHLVDMGRVAGRVIVPFMLRERHPCEQNAEQKGSGADQGFHHGFAECYPPHCGRKGRTLFGTRKPIVLFAPGFPDEMDDGPSDAHQCQKDGE